MEVEPKVKPPEVNPLTGIRKGYKVGESVFPGGWVTLSVDVPADYSQANSNINQWNEVMTPATPIEPGC